MEHSYPHTHTNTHNVNMLLSKDKLNIARRIWWNCKRILKFGVSDKFFIQKHLPFDGKMYRPNMSTPHAHLYSATVFFLDTFALTCSIYIVWLKSVRIWELVHVRMTHPFESEWSFPQSKSTSSDSNEWSMYFITTIDFHYVKTACSRVFWSNVCVWTNI